MGAVIDADADDPLRIGDHRQELQGGQCTVRRAAGGEPFDFGERVRRECLTQARELSVGERRNVDDAIAGHDAEARIAVGYITRELHWLRSPVWSARNSEHALRHARAFGTRRRRGRARGSQRISCVPSRYLQLDERCASRKLAPPLKESSHLCGIPIQLSVAIISHMPFDPVYGDRLARLLLETVA